MLVFDAQTQTELGMGGSEVVSVSDIEALTNHHPLSHVYLWGGQGPLGPDSPIGPAFFHAEGGSPGGAATVVGVTQFAFPTALRAYEDEYFRLLIDEDVRALGETLGRARLPFVPFSAFDGVNRWTQMSLELFGDPQLSLPRRAAYDSAHRPPDRRRRGGRDPGARHGRRHREARRRRDRVPRGRGDHDRNDRRAGRCGRAVRRACAGRHPLTARLAGSPTRL